MIADLDSTVGHKDSKTLLQEWLQAQRYALPVYQVESESGPAHNRTFTVCCRLDELKLNALGVAPSRKKAEQMAAQSILEELKSINDE